MECRTLILFDEDREGYTRTVNRGLLEAEGGDVCIVVDDAVMSDGWLRTLHDEVHKRREPLNVWFAGPSMRCRTAPQNQGRRGDKRRPRIVDHVCGACLYATSDVVKNVGLMDARMVMYASEVDWQWQAQTKFGTRTIWVPEVWCEHELHEPSCPDWWHHDHALLRQKWGR